MKWFYIAVTILFIFGTIGERDKEKSIVYGVIAVIGLVLIYLMR